jgi:hypothetical protein
MGDALEAIREMARRVRLGRLEAQVAQLSRLKADVASEAHVRLQRGQPVSRAGVAAYLGVSTKTIQRMEAQGKLRRCPGMGGVVLYSARDVLRLASAR